MLCVSLPHSQARLRHLPSIFQNSFIIIPYNINLTAENVHLHTLPDCQLDEDRDFWPWSCPRHTIGALIWYINTYQISWWYTLSSKQPPQTRKEKEGKIFRKRAYMADSGWAESWHKDDLVIKKIPLLFLKCSNIQCKNHGSGFFTTLKIIENYFPHSL